jgi:hypothetical protein
MTPTIETNNQTSIDLSSNASLSSVSTDRPNLNKDYTNSVKATTKTGYNNNNMIVSSYEIQPENDFILNVSSSSEDSGVDYELLPSGHTFIDIQNTSKRLIYNYILHKIDRAFYEPLSLIAWDFFVSLQFTAKKFRHNSDTSRKKRKMYIYQLFHRLNNKLNLSTNDIQWFCTEENNADDEYHCHIIVKCVYPDKSPLEQTRLALMDLINPQIVIIPSQTNSKGEPLHVQTIYFQDRCLRYVLKTNWDQTEPKPYFHSFKFVRWYNRHINRAKKQTITA